MFAFRHIASRGPAMRSRIYVLLALLAPLVFLSLTSAEASGPARKDGLKIGLAKTLFHNVTMPQFQVIAATFQTVLEKQTGMKGQLLPGGSPDEIRQQLDDGAIHLGVMHGVEFGWMKLKQPDLEPMMLNMIDPDWLRPIVVVAKSHAAKSLQQCRGQKLAIIKSAREDTRLFFSRLCREHDCTVDEMFPRFSTPNSVEDALDELVDGKIQLAVLEQASLAMYQRRKPARAANVRVLEDCEPFPPSVIVFRREKIDVATIKSFRNGMSTAHNSVLGAHLMSLMRIRKFEVPDDNYAKHLAEALKEYPPIEVARGSQK